MPSPTCCRLLAAEFSTLAESFYHIDECAYYWKGPPPPEVGLGETMAELAVLRGNSARRVLFQLRTLGAL